MILIHKFSFDLGIPVSLIVLGSSVIEIPILISYSCVLSMAQEDLAIVIATLSLDDVEISTLTLKFSNCLSMIAVSKPQQ